MLIPLLGGAALVWILASMKGKGDQPLPASDVSADVSNQITQAVSSPNMADKQRAHDMIVRHPQGQEPQMELARQLLANQLTQGPPTIAIGPVTRREYRLQLAKLFPDGVRMFDVFTSGGTRLLRFRQDFDNTATRKNLGPASGADPELVQSAVADFGLAS